MGNAIAWNRSRGFAPARVLATRSWVVAGSHHAKLESLLGRFALTHALRSNRAYTTRDPNL